LKVEDLADGGGFSTVHAEGWSIDHVDMRVAVGRMGIEQSAGLMCMVCYQ